MFWGFFLIQWSFEVLVPKSRLFLVFLFLVFLPIALLPSLDSLFPVFMHTITLLSPPPSLTHPCLAPTLHKLLQKLVFKNPLCDFCIDFYSKCAECTK